MYDNDTIVAPATSTGKSSVNIIRLSGVKSLAVAESIFMPKKYKISENPRKMVYGHIVDKDKVILRQRNHNDKQKQITCC